MATSTRLTIDDFEKLPDEAVKHRELVDGELIDVSGNTPNHNGLKDLIISLLLPFVRERKLGRVLSEQEYDFHGNVHGPDVSFFGNEKCELCDGNKRVQRFVPDLAIEIVSQKDTFDSLMKKARRYRDCGTAEVWIFSIEMQQAFLMSDGQNVILNENQEFRPETIPGFSIRLGDLLARI
jgi:Uma2 family endonuclease